MGVADKSCVGTFVRLREGLCWRFVEGSRQQGERAFPREEVIVGVVVSNCVDTIWSIDWVLSAGGVIKTES